MESIMQKILEEKLLAKGANLFGVYRLKRSRDEHRFHSLECMEVCGFTPTKQDYALEYVGEMAERFTLADIFYLLNEKHPEDYIGPSLSVGDIVVITMKGGTSAYFVDRIGFKDLPDFLTPEPKADVESLPAQCPLCGQALENGERFCGRCSILHDLLGEDIGMDAVVHSFWDHCFQCEAEIVASVELTPDSLIVQCDECGEVHPIPFTAEDIRRYVRSGIVREMVADCL